MARLSVSVIAFKAIVSHSSFLFFWRGKREFYYPPFVDFQLGFAQPIKVIARKVFTLRLISGIIQLEMSVHERLFDVFKNGSRVCCWSVVDLENHEKLNLKGLERNESTRWQHKSTNCILCSTRGGNANEFRKCKLANQEHSTTLLSQTLRLNAKKKKAHKTF